MSRSATKILAYAVRGPAILRYQGELFLSLAGIALGPAVVAGIEGNDEFMVRAGVCTLALGSIGVALRRIRGPRQIRPNEAMIVMSASYLLIAALMAWPLTSEGLAPVDSFFHAMSAVTTTGMATIAPTDARSVTFLFAQAWMQWYGGLVIIVLAVFLIGPGSIAKRLSTRETYDTDMLGGTRNHARRVLGIYAVLTVACVLLLRALGADWFDATLHAMTAISTGGFSSYGDGLSGISSWPLQAAVLLLCVMGAISFSRYRDLLVRRHGTHRRRQFPAEVAALLGFGVIVSIVIGCRMAAADGTTWLEALKNAPLVAFAAQTTAGFSPVEIASLDDATKLTLIASMFVGGDVGSSAGGIKIFRVLFLLRLLQLFVLRPALPQHAVIRVRHDGKGLDDREIHDALAIVALFAGVVLASWFVFLLFGYPPIDSLFEVVSASGTVGLSTGLARPELEPLLKGILCLDMWMGRLEVLAVLILFTPRTWFGRRPETE